MRRWIKNGLIGVGVMIVLFLLGLVIDVFTPIVAYLSFIIWPIVEFYSAKTWPSNFLFILDALIMLFLWFTYGVIIGWIIGKIRYRN